MLVNMDMFGESGGGGADHGFIPWSELSGQSSYPVDLGYKPKRITWYAINPTYHNGYFYDENMSQTNYYGVQYTVAVHSGTTISMSTTYWNGLGAVGSTGFTLCKFDSAYGGDGIYWFASKD